MNRKEIIEKSKNEMNNQLFYSAAKRMLEYLEETETASVVGHDLLVMQKIAEYVQKHHKEEWDKMGNTGEDGYWENATRDELWHFGRFRAFEDIQDFIESNFSA